MFSAETIAYPQTKQFTRIVADYLGDAEDLRSFYSHRPTEEGIRAAIAARRNTPAHREALVAVLRDQYTGIADAEPVLASIESLLSENTFTITTAHQPNLLGGPLYFVYKILHAIRLAAHLGTSLPGHRFVPVFYMGSEDADLEELNHFSVAGKRYTWQTSQQGAVGRMKVDKNLLQLLDELQGQLAGEASASELMAIFRKAFVAGKTIQQATFEWVHSLFGRFGLVILIADDARLKRMMQPVFEKDLFEGLPSEIVGATSTRLDALYEAQAHPRPINLFYLREGLRNRIERRGEEFVVVSSDIRFSPADLRNELEQHPERFSPNVILRGLYQETILPNIAFLGGGGELAYWLQLKDLFERFEVPFPVLVLRNSYLLADAAQAALCRKLGLRLTDLFEEELALSDRLLEKAGRRPRLNGEVEEIRNLYARLSASAAAVDPTLGTHVAALQAQALRRIDELEKKMLRAGRRRESATLRQLKKLRESLFPGGGLQERKESFVGYYARWGSAFIDALYQHAPSLEQQFTLLAERER